MQHRRQRSSLARPAPAAREPAPLSPAELDARLDAALARRRPLLTDRQTTALRVLHGASDGIAGLVLEKLGPVLIAQCHEGQLPREEAPLRRLCENAMTRLGAAAVYRKSFVRDRAGAMPLVDAAHHDPQPWIGAPSDAQLAVLDHSVRFLVRPYDGYATGLFLEHRSNRQRVRAMARDRRVLNLFAYTCGYSVCAALGGAAQVASVDISAKALDWGRENLALNGLDAAQQLFFRSDAAEFLRRAARQQRRYDLIILDPPTFARLRGVRTPFSIKTALPGLLRDALRLLDAGGQLLACCNHRGTTARDLVRHAQAGLGERRLRQVEHLPLPADFHGDDDYAKSVLFTLD